MHKAYVAWIEYANGKVKYQAEIPNVRTPVRRWCWQAQLDLSRWVKSQDQTKQVRVGRVSFHPMAGVILGEAVDV